MVSISIKNDLILRHIEALEPGTRISVRELAARLQVSEGTAYKAVKDAEQRGLVAVKPKVGTVRIQAEPPTLEGTLRARELVRLLGLTVCAGKANLHREIRRLAVCDGSEQSLLRQLAGQEPQSCLCLCGDRPELMDFVLRQGANLLLTGGASAGMAQLQAAERKGLYLLSSPQSSCALLRQFEHTGTASLSPAGRGRVSDWMQQPAYLYYNDITADWQHLYFASGFPKQYPLVDDNLELFGGLDLWTATASVPSQRLRSMMADTESFLCISARDELKDVARKFVVNGDSYAAVLEGKRLVGILTATDLLRSYMYTESASSASVAASFLVKDLTVSDDMTQIYSVRIPDSELAGFEHVETDLLLSAAADHLKNTGCTRYRFESGTFYATRRIASAEGLMLTSRLQQNSPHSCIVEAEINDDRYSYAKFVLVASVDREEQEG